MRWGVSGLPREVYMRTKPNGFIYVAVVAVLAAPAFSGGGISGKTIFKQKCQSCHTGKEKGGRLGPELTNVGRKRDEQYIVNKLRSPQKTNPETVMPTFKDLMPQEFEAVADYLRG